MNRLIWVQTHSRQWLRTHLCSVKPRRMLSGDVWRCPECGQRWRRRSGPGNEAYPINFFGKPVRR